MLEDDSAAAYHFRLALAEAPSEQVEATIEQFLDAIERRRTTAFSLQLSLLPDSNVNAGTTSDTINLFGFLPSDLSEDAKETSGLGFRTAVTGTWLPRLSEDWRGELRGTALVTDYGGSRYDDVAAGIEVGARHIRPRGYWTASLGYDRRWYAGDPYYDAWTARLSAVRRLTPRWVGFVGASEGVYDYAVEQGRDGPVTTLSGGASYALSSASLASARLSVAYEDAEAAARRNTTYALQTSYSREYANALTIEVTPFAAYRPFDGFDALFGETRLDVRYGTAFDVLNREWSYRGFSPAVTYTATRNESNVVIYDYTRHQVELRLTRTF